MVTIGFVLFILRDIPDSCPLVIESALKMLGNFLTHWKAVLTNEQATKVRNNVFILQFIQPTVANTLIIRS